MTIRIGRFGIDLAAGELGSWDESAESCMLSGVTAYSSAAEAEALRQQLQGYADQPDESFVPVTWERMPSIDGFYRVKSVSVNAKAGLAPQGVFAWSVQLERVSGFAAPMIESTCIGKTRAQTSVVRTNLLKNPSGRRGSTGWSALGGSLVSVPGSYLYAGAASSQPYAALGLNYGLTVGTDISAYTTYTFSASVDADGVNAFLYVAGTGVVAASTSSSANGFTVISTTFTTTASGSVSVRILNAAATVAPHRVYVRDAMVEAGPYLSPYVDGSLTPNATTTYAWTGTADNSSSTATSVVVAAGVITAPGSSKSMVITERTSGLSSSPTASQSPTSDGAVRLFPLPSGMVSGQFYCPPNKFYEGAATLKIGTALRVATGRQIPSDVQNWEISNGLIKLRAAFALAQMYEISRWTGSAWTGWESIAVGYRNQFNSYSDFSVPHSITVLRNSPEAVTLRVLSSQQVVSVGSFFSDFPVTVDITIRRGAEFAAFELRTINAQTPLIKISNFSTSITPATHAYYSTATGVFIASPQNFGGLTTELSISNPASNQAWSFAIGNTASIKPSNGQAPIPVYFWAGSEKMDVVKR